MLDYWTLEPGGVNRLEHSEKARRRLHTALQERPTADEDTKHAILNLANGVSANNEGVQRLTPRKNTGVCRG